MEFTKVDKLCKMLKYFEAGNTKKINGHWYGMVDNEIVVYPLKWEGECLIDEPNLDHPLRAEWNLKFYIDLAQGLSNEDLFIMDSERVLTNMNKKVR